MITLVLNTPWIMIELFRMKCANTCANIANIIFMRKLHASQHSSGKG